MANDKAIKPGPYDRTAAELLQHLHADAVVIVVFGGRAGTAGAVATTSAARFITLHALTEKLLAGEPTPKTIIEV